MTAAATRVKVATRGGRRSAKAEMIEGTDNTPRMMPMVKMRSGFTAVRPVSCCVGFPNVRLARIGGVNQTFLTGRNAQDVGGAGDVERNAGGHDDLIQWFGIALFAGGAGGA